MPTDRIAELIRHAVADSGVRQALANDPASLRTRMNLTGAELAALRSAAQFTPAAPGSFPADTGTLLPPRGSGEFTGAPAGPRPRRPGKCPECRRPVHPKPPHPLRRRSLIRARHRQYRPLQ
jgi:hypothetical protein